MVDLKEAAGPYKAGAQMIEPLSPPGPTYAPDFQEMARVIRKGQRPSYSPLHDLMVQEVFFQACGMLEKPTNAALPFNPKENP